MHAEFEDVYYTVSYVNPKENLENTEQVNKILDCGKKKDYLYIIFQYHCAIANLDNIMI